MWLLWNVWKREIERRVRVKLIKGLAPIQYNIFQLKYILLKRFLLVLCLGIDIDTTGLFTNLLFVSVLAPIFWNCHKVTRFRGSIQLLFCSQLMQFFPIHLVLTIRPINCDVNCRWNFIISLLSSTPSWIKFLSNLAVMSRWESQPVPDNQSLTVQFLPSQLTYQIVSWYAQPFYEEQISKRFVKKSCMARMRGEALPGPGLVI